MKVNVDDIKSISQNKRSRFFKDSFFKNKVKLSHLGIYLYVGEGDSQFTKTYLQKK